MKKKSIICIMLIIIFNILIISNYCYAAGDAQGWIDKIKSSGTSSELADAENSIDNVIGIILGVVKIVAIGISIIMLTFLGIKYMSAAPNEKASIKNQLITFTIGAIFVFGAAEILTLITDIVNETLE